MRSHSRRRMHKATPIRRWWYHYYRQTRIVRREVAKSIEDMILFGSGFTMITNEPDYIKHIPLEQVRLYTNPGDSNDGPTRS